MRQLVSSVVLYVLLGPIVHAASFDCTKAVSFSEKTICADEELFALDDLMARAYSEALSKEPSLRESQRQWLKHRNTCKTRQCLVGAYQERISEISRRIAKPPEPRSFDGEWEVEWSCEGATGFYAERCVAGDRDYFLLQLQTSGGQICGYHIATAHLGNRIDDSVDTGDEPSILGTISASAADIQFKSTWGASGTAILRLEGDELHWHVVNTTGGVGDASWLPDDAILTNTRTSLDHARHKCMDHLPIERRN